MIYPICEKCGFGKAFKSRKRSALWELLIFTCVHGELVVIRRVKA